MGSNEEGGIRTQKLNVTLIAMALFIGVGLAGAIVLADDASAEDSNAAYSVSFDNSHVATKRTATATLKFKEETTSIFSSVSWSAKLVNSKGVSQSGALDKTSGNSSDADSTWTIVVTAPENAEKYTLEVTFTEKINDAGTSKTLDEVTSSAALYVEEPIKLSVTVENTDKVAVNNADVYFYIDGKKIEDSKTVLTVSPNSNTTITYDYYDSELSSGKHSFYVEAGDASNNIKGLGEENSYTFYYKQGDMNYMNYVIGLVLVVLVILCIVVYRRPVRNYGKPKARR